MAQSINFDGQTIYIPGAYAKTVIQNQNSSLGTNGVVLLMGESSMGAHWSQETDITETYFGPNEESEVRAKFGSGRLVDAYKASIAASNDPDITGAPQRFILIKTNSGAQSTGAISTYAGLTARNYGTAGNLITRTVTQSQAESLPTTGSFVYAPPQVSTAVAFRVNGGAEVSTTIAAATLPSAAASAINALSGPAATGGVSRSLVTSVAGTLTMVVDSGFQCHVNLASATWANNPTVGDIVYIPTGSPMAAANEGTYVVTAVSTTRLDLYKVLDAAGAGSTRTAPTNEGPIAIAAITDIQAFSPVVITLEAGSASAGLGKSLEIAESGSGQFRNNAWTFSASASPVASNSTWVSKSGTPQVLTSVAEQKMNINVARGSDSVSEDFICGGTVVLTLGYTGTSASVVIAAGIMTITVVGGAGASPAAITLANYPTVGDLVNYLNSLTGFTAAAATAAQSQKSPADLDAGTYTFASTHGAATGRIKADGKDVTSVVSGSQLVTIAPISPATALIGLPAAATVGYLTGGSIGGTTDAAISAALTKATSLRCNFVVPLFSQDATADISAGETHSSSTYTIASINAAVRSHVLSQSTTKRKRSRFGLVSIKGSFTDAKNAAGNQASQRMVTNFIDCKDLDSNGTLKQFQPWMTAVKAAAMQAAGFYKGLVFKQINISGLVHQDFDFNSEDQIEDALRSGLMVARPAENGGYQWVSDQTTYSKDNNVILNSLQAMYALDLIASTLTTRMELAFVGQSVADISLALAKTVFESILDDLRGLKLITPDAEAPAGYRNATIKRSGVSLPCGVEVKVTNQIMFVPITILASVVQD